MSIEDQIHKKIIDNAQTNVHEYNIVSGSI